MIQQTSLEAYWGITNLSARQQAVYNVISSGPISNLQIAYQLQIPINQVTPRTNELVAKSVVKEAYRDVSPITGKKVIFWQVVTA